MRDTETKPVYGPEGQVDWIDYEPDPADLPQALDVPVPIDQRLPTPQRFVPMNLRHHYRYDAEEQMFHRLPGYDDHTVLTSSVEWHQERDTRDPHFATKRTIKIDGTPLLPKDMRPA